MVFSEFKKKIYASNLDDSIKGQIFAMCNVINDLKKLEGEKWPMKNSEWSGVPVQSLPFTYIKAGLDGRSPNFIRSHRLREILKKEFDRRLEAT